jgi:hypothetical protein
MLMAHSGLTRVRDDAYTQVKELNAIVALACVDAVGPLLPCFGLLQVCSFAHCLHHTCMPFVFGARM